MALPTRHHQENNMKSSTKIFAAIAAAGIMGVGALAIAQPGTRGSGNCDGYMGTSMAGGGMRGANFNPAARADQHLARLKADLKLTAAQEPLWQAFAENAKAEAGKGFEAMRANAQDLSLSAPERMNRMVEVMKQRVVAMESVNASFTRLYDALSPDQKRVADIHAARMGHGGQRGHMGRGGPQGPAGTPATPPKG
jgi:periplasmic protein CpxP/Spy